MDSSLYMDTWTPNPSIAGMGKAVRLKVAQPSLWADRSFLT